MKKDNLQSCGDAVHAISSDVKLQCLQNVAPRVSAMRLNRVAVSTIFFMHGLCFASWASRIPSIQEKLNLSSAALGTILFALPVGFFVSLPFAGWLVGILKSKRVVILSAVLYSISLLSIGAASSTLMLFACLFSFGFFANLLNIAINTQAVAVEGLYQKKIMASFHGLWSLAGFVGAALGTWMMSHAIAPLQHYIVIAMVFIVMNIVCAFYLLNKDETSGEKRPLFAMPDKALLSLGIIAFCSMMVEGAMFDWSGLYFIQVVKVKPEYTGLGYTIFMVAMAGMRFLADGFSDKFGLKRILQVSGLLTTTGLVVAVLLPRIIPSTLGFFLIGVGVSSVVPMVYSAAGRSKSLSPGTALTAVSSMGFIGLLIGPPIIGFIAEATSLRISFLAISIMSVAVLVFASMMRGSAGKKTS
jgi:MFS family permease